MRTAPPDDAENDCAAYLISLFNPPLKASVYGGDELARTPANLAPRLIHVTAAPVNRMLRDGNFSLRPREKFWKLPCSRLPEALDFQSRCCPRAAVYTEFSLGRFRMATFSRKPRQEKQHGPRAGFLVPVLGFFLESSADQFAVWLLNVRRISETRPPARTLPS